jgi:hypothetical protein
MRIRDREFWNWCDTQSDTTLKHTCGSSPCSSSASSSPKSPDARGGSTIIVKAHLRMSATRLCAATFFGLTCYFHETVVKVGEGWVDTWRKEDMIIIMIVDVFAQL